MSIFQLTAVSFPVRVCHLLVKTSVLAVYVSLFTELHLKLFFVLISLTCMCLCLVSPL